MRDRRWRSCPSSYTLQIPLSFRTCAEEFASIALVLMTNSERLNELSGAFLASVLELLAERKVNHPDAALSLTPNDLTSSWDLVAESAALPDPPGQPDAGEEVASDYWYEQALDDLVEGGFLSELEDHSFLVPDLEALLKGRSV
jgi:hypothetical protein